MTTHNLIIIWSWPAWHTAAIYAARANLQPLMFEGLLAWGVAAGWQLTTTTTVENFPGFPHGIMWPELMDNMRQQSLNNGVEIKTQTVDSVDLSIKPFKVTARWQDYFAHSLIIATGATAKKLDKPWVTEYWMRGISGCAVCDGALPIFRNKTLIVIWGWDVAMEEATHLSHFWSKVIIILRRTKADLRASKAMQERVFANEKIEFMENSELHEVVWNGDLMSGVKIINNLTWEITDVSAGWLFFAIGHTPNTGFLGGQIEVDESGYIITQKWNTSTSVSWVFAAWDVQDKVYRQAITSAWTWCMAALEAEKRLQENK